MYGTRVIFAVLTRRAGAHVFRPSLVPIRRAARVFRLSLVLRPIAAARLLLRLRLPPGDSHLAGYARNNAGGSAAFELTGNFRGTTRLKILSTGLRCAPCVPGLLEIDTVETEVRYGSVVNEQLRPPFEKPYGLGVTVRRLRQDAPGRFRRERDNTVKHTGIHMFSGEAGTYHIVTFRHKLDPGATKVRMENAGRLKQSLSRLQIHEVQKKGSKDASVRSILPIQLGNPRVAGVLGNRSRAVLGRCSCLGERGAGNNRFDMGAGQ